MKKLLALALFILALGAPSFAQCGPNFQVGVGLPGGGYLQVGNGGYCNPYPAYPVAYPAYQAYPVYPAPYYRPRAYSRGFYSRPYARPCYPRPHYRGHGGYRRCR